MQQPPSDQSVLNQHYSIRKALRAVLLGASKSSDTACLEFSQSLLNSVCNACDDVCRLPVESAPIDYEVLLTKLTAVFAEVAPEVAEEARTAAANELMDKLKSVLKVLPLAPPLPTPSSTSSNRKRAKEDEQQNDQDEAAKQKPRLEEIPSAAPATHILEPPPPSVGLLPIPQSVFASVPPPCAFSEETRCITFEGVPVEMNDPESVRRTLMRCVGSIVLNVHCVPSQLYCVVSFESVASARAVLCSATAYFGLRTVTARYSSQQECASLHQDGIGNVRSVEERTHLSLNAYDDNTVAIASLDVRHKKLTADIASADEKLKACPPEDKQEKLKLLQAKIDLQKDFAEVVKQLSVFESQGLTLASVNLVSSSKELAQNPNCLLQLSGFEFPMPDKKLLLLLEPFNATLVHIWRSKTNHDVCAEFGTPGQAAHVLRFLDPADFCFCGIKFSRMLTKNAGG